MNVLDNVAMGGGREVGRKKIRVRHTKLMCGVLGSRTLVYPMPLNRVSMLSLLFFNFNLFMSLIAQTRTSRKKRMSQRNLEIKEPFMDDLKLGEVEEIRPSFVNFASLAFKDYARSIKVNKTRIPFPFLITLISD